MAPVIDKRVTAEIEGDFVVFLIGMRVNAFWKGWKWLPVFLAMPRMLRELEKSPNPASSAPTCTSAARGDRWSFSTGAPLSIWRPMHAARTPPIGLPGSAFNKRVGSNGDVGIWHETYLVPAGSYECAYNNMPPIGLGMATSLVAAAGRKATAASRAGVRDEAYPEGAPTNGIEV